MLQLQNKQKKKKKVENIFLGKFGEKLYDGNIPNEKKQCEKSEGGCIKRVNRAELGLYFSHLMHVFRNFPSKEVEWKYLAIFTVNIKNL